MATMNISLPDPMRDWVQAQVDAGKYANASDYMRDLIRHDQERDDKLRALQGAITKGLESGEPFEFDYEAFTREALAKIR